MSYILLAIGVCFILYGVFGGNKGVSNKVELEPFEKLPEPKKINADSGELLHESEFQSQVNNILSDDFNENLFTDFSEIKADEAVSVVEPVVEEVSEVETIEPMVEEISEVETIEPVVEEISEVEAIEPVVEEISEVETIEPVVEEISEVETIEPVVEEVSEVEAIEPVIEEVDETAEVGVEETSKTGELIELANLNVIKKYNNVIARLIEEATQYLSDNAYLASQKAKFALDNFLIQYISDNGAQEDALTVIKNINGIKYNKLDEIDASYRSTVLLLYLSSAKIEAKYQLDADAINQLQTFNSISEDITIAEAKGLVEKVYVLCYGYFVSNNLMDKVNRFNFLAKRNNELLNVCNEIDELVITSPKEASEKLYKNALPLFLRQIIKENNHTEKALQSYFDLSGVVFDKLSDLSYDYMLNYISIYSKHNPYFIDGMQFDDEVLAKFNNIREHQNQTVDTELVESDIDVFCELVKQYCNNHQVSDVFESKVEEKVEEAGETKEIVEISSEEKVQLADIIHKSNENVNVVDVFAFMKNKNKEIYDALKEAEVSLIFSYKDACQKLARFVLEPFLKEVLLEANKENGIVGKNVQYQCYLEQKKLKSEDLTFEKYLKMPNIKFNNVLNTIKQSKLYQRINTVEYLYKQQKSLLNNRLGLNDKIIKRMTCLRRLGNQASHHIAPNSPNYVEETKEMVNKVFYSVYRLLGNYYGYKEMVNIKVFSDYLKIDRYDIYYQKGDFYFGYYEEGISIKEYALIKRYHRNDVDPLVMTRNNDMLGALKDGTPQGIDLIPEIRALNTNCSNEVEDYYVAYVFHRKPQLLSNKVLAEMEQPIERLNVCKEIVSGITKLHELQEPIYHRLINNKSIVLLDYSKRKMGYKPQLIGFDYSKITGIDQKYTVQFAHRARIEHEIDEESTAVEYLPEIESVSDYAKLDIYALGVLFFKILAGDVKFKLPEFKRLITEFKFSETLVKVLMTMCDSDEDARPTAHEVLNAFEEEIQQWSN